MAFFVLPATLEVKFSVERYFPLHSLLDDKVFYKIGGVKAFKNASCKKQYSSMQQHHLAQRIVNKLDKRK